VENIRLRLTEKGFHTSIIWSKDEIGKLGLLDIIPARANKLQAIKFLIEKEQFFQQRTVFAGDSGNDLDVLTSGLQTILVKNAPEEVRREAIETLSKKRIADRLYLPQGDFFGMNGNYAAGVLEGLVRFIPETETLIAEALKQIK